MSGDLDWRSMPDTDRPNWEDGGALYSNATNSSHTGQVTMEDIIAMMETLEIPATSMWCYFCNFSMPLQWCPHHGHIRQPLQITPNGEGQS